MAEGQEDPSLTDATVKSFKGNASPPGGTSPKESPGNQSGHCDNYEDSRASSVSSTDSLSGSRPQTAAAGHAAEKESGIEESQTAVGDEMMVGLRQYASCIGPQENCNPSKY